MADRCIPQNVLLIWSLCLTTSSLQQMIGNLTSWRRLYCVLRGGKLFCYYSPEEIEAKVEPALTVSINKVKMIIWGFFCLLVFWCLFLFLMIILRVVIFVSRLIPLGLKLLVCKKLCRQCQWEMLQWNFQLLIFFCKGVTCLSSRCKLLLLH